MALAQNQPLNPLEVEIDRSDPIIPFGYQKRKLSTFEINRIKREMNRLARQAQKESKGNMEHAFKLWYRQLKLARAVNTETEVEALGKVGEIAWQANRGEDLRNVSNRLMAIESEIGVNNLSASQLEQFSNAYQQVRYLDRAIAIYEQILANNKQQGSSIAVAENRQALGKLYLANFNYQKAANTYQKLIETALTKSPIDKKISFYQQTLSDIYDRTSQTKQALNVKLDLITTYKASGKLDRLATLELALARDYQTLNNTDRAVESYGRATTLASSNKQLTVANDALKGLAKLYQTVGKTDEAIASYTKLLKLQRQSYNHYGLINTYDSVGKIYLRLEQRQQAKQVFQQALEMARDLDYKINYFTTQIEKL